MCDPGVMMSVNRATRPSSIIHSLFLLAFSFAIGGALIIATSAPCNAQFLRSKHSATSAETTPVSEPEVTVEKRHDESRDVASHPDVPAWERLFFEAIDSIDSAISSAEESLLAANQLESSKPLLARDQRQRTLANYYDTIGSRKITLHMELSDILPGTVINPRKQWFILKLRNPDFPSHRYDEELSVAISPSEARRLEIGSTVRLDGQLGEKTRRTFDHLDFVRFAGQSPLAGEDQDVLQTKPDPTLLGRHYVFTLYVEKARVLPGQNLQEYREFKVRYRQRLAEFQQPYRQRPDTPRSPSRPGGGSRN